MHCAMFIVWSRERETESDPLAPLSLLHIILGCPLKPPLSAPVYKTLLCFRRDKRRGGETEKDGEGEGKKKKGEQQWGCLA